MPDRSGTALMECILIMTPMVVLMIIVMLVKKSIAKKVFIAMISLFILSIIYCCNTSFYYFINFYIVPSRTCTIEYSDDLSNSSESIKLPTKSTYMYKSPEKVYFTKHEVNECVNYFKNTLTKMKKNKEIKTFEFNDIKNEFDVQVYSGLYYRISVEKYSYPDVSLYGISPLKNKAYLDY